MSRALVLCLHLILIECECCLGDSGSALSISERHDRGATIENRNRCAANSLAVCFRIIGASSAALRHVDNSSLKGEETSLKDCADVAQQYGLLTAGLRWAELGPEFSLHETPAVIPIVLQNGRRHFVAAIGFKSDQLLITDYPFPPKWVPSEGLRKSWHWDGTMLHIVKDSAAHQRLLTVAARGAQGSVMYLVAGLSCIIVGLVLFLRRTARTIPVANACRLSNRTGFTIIELLVSLGIISLLVGLMLPALQAARESARKATCVNRLHQIGIALHSFEASQGKFPASSVVSIGQDNARTNNIPAQVGLLPYLERRELFDQFDQNETGDGLWQDPPTSTVNAQLLVIALDIFSCPSDSLNGNHCNYRISFGTSPGLHETLPKSPKAALRGFAGRRRDAEFVDGKSHTAAFAEKLAGDQDVNRYTSWRDLAVVTAGPPGLLTPDLAMVACERPVDAAPQHFSYGGMTWALSGYPQTWYNHVLAPNSMTPDCVEGGLMGLGAFTARSLHPGCVNVLYADGSVRPVSNSIDLEVWRALGTVAGGENVSSE